MNIAVGTLATPAALASSSAAVPAAESFDVKAALARLEQIIEILRTRAVCHGWHDGGGLDETGAARALAYFRAGCPEESDKDFAERREVFQFLRDHGQSLDWIICGDPVALICGAAKNSGRASAILDHELLALGVELDAFLPQYHAQQAKNALHRAAWEAECLRLGLPRLELGTVSDEEWRERNQARLHVRTIYSDEEDKDVGGDGVSIAWTRLHDEMYSILDRVIDCQPKTKAGLGVMARVVSLDCDSHHDSSSISEATELLMMALCKFCGVDPVLRPENEVEAEDGDDDAEEDAD